MNTSELASLVASDDADRQEVSVPGVDELVELGILTVADAVPTT